MKPATLLAAVAAMAPAVMAVDKMKNVIVWADNDSITDAMLEQAKEAILEAGGKITHDYTLIR